MDKLKPCPFCGGEAEFHPQEHHMNSMWSHNTICCPNCDLKMQDVSKTKLLEKWNRRAKDVD